MIEEAPSPALNAKEREYVGNLAANLVKKMGYLGVGTIEFLYEDGKFYFMEMNTRLQVEHPITEMITGIDIVREQIRVATGAPLTYKQEDVHFLGHAMECRVNAENPETFIPCPGRITHFHQPGGLGVRVDSAIYEGYKIPPHYDSLIAKIIVHGLTRNECMMRLRRTLEECVISGVETTLPLQQKIIKNNDFINGDYSVKWLEARLKDGDL